MDNNNITTQHIQICSVSTNCKNNLPHTIIDPTSITIADNRIETSGTKSMKDEYWTEDEKLFLTPHLTVLPHELTEEMKKDIEKWEIEKNLPTKKKSNYKEIHYTPTTIIDSKFIKVKDSIITKYKGEETVNKFEVKIESNSIEILDSTEKNGARITPNGVVFSSDVIITDPNLNTDIVLNSLTGVISTKTIKTLSCEAIDKGTGEKACLTPTKLEFPKGHIEIDSTTGIISANDIYLRGADCAEDFDIVENELLEPGTVLVLNGDGKLCKSTTPYDKKVVGVISGAGNYKPGIHLDKKTISDISRAPVALVGKVFCKVVVGSEPIQPGDLLTTSDKSGYAMKAIDPIRAFGSVIGKSMGALSEGVGLIPILVSLQ